MSRAVESSTLRHQTAHGSVGSDTQTRRDLRDVRARARMREGLAFRAFRAKPGEDAMNNVKVFVLMAGMTALFVAIGGAVGGQGGMLMALVFAGLMNFFMYWTSSSMVLRMYGARSITREQAP